MHIHTLQISVFDWLSRCQVGWNLQVWPFEVCDLRARLGSRGNEKWDAVDRTLHKFQLFVKKKLSSLTSVS